MRVLLIATAACWLPAVAQAHITLKEPEEVGGATYEAVLVVGHGCDGAPTTTLRVQIPEGMVAVKPRPKPGWQLETVIGAYASPRVNEGVTLTEGVREVIWSGGELPDEWYDEFSLRGVLPEGERGTVIYFPVVQECGSVVDRWIEIPGAGEDPQSLLEPAPGVTLIEAEGAGGHAH